ncbi:MAG: aspartate--tRNA ligase [Planctomycetes bacterium]|nr:aspartate--tRNA ligase [Planctomycetota bacterium]
MARWQRTHTCGDLRTDHVGSEVVLNGWIENHRHHGAVLFVDLRDRYGVTQVVFEQERDGALFERGRRLGAEDVLSVRGVVNRREQPNPDRATGEIEVVVTELEVLAESEPPPFEVLDVPEASEELRMRYRYLDLRRRPVQEALVKRAAFVTAVRKHLASLGFVDIETPVLTRSTPEGARDYLVPSRVHPGSFYALPQSPQIFKQLCMVGGLDRYYQIARCFRDEDLRADRQPEFTQIDLEMSFVEENDVLDVVEQTMVAAFREAFGIELAQPFPRLDYFEAVSRYGNDKPDLRFGIELVDVGALAAKSGFQVFRNAVETGGAVKGLCVPGGGERFSRKDVEKDLGGLAGAYGAKGLAWAKVGADGALAGSIAKFFEGAAGHELCGVMGAKPGDLLLFVADELRIVHRALAELRLAVGDRLGLRTPGEFRFAWVLNFPMFERDDETGGWASSHHPFTAPVDWDLEDYSASPGTVRSRAYDIVMNGWELGSGSIRIHRREVQERVFRFLGIDAEEQQRKFGFLLDAFRYGAPPHGGIALGVDRLITLALGAPSIRDVIAFPKTATATDLMCQAPSGVSARQLEELHIGLSGKALRPDAEGGAGS